MAATTSQSLQIQFHDAQCFDAIEGAVLRVLEGAVWLMEQGFAQDRLFTAGDAVVLRSRGKAWLEACASSHVLVTA